MSTSSRLGFPLAFRVRVVEETSGEPAPNVALKLHLSASRRNDYSFIPALTNADGVTLIERDWVAKSITEYIRLAPMDYVSTLDDCAPMAMLEVMSEAGVDRAVEGSRIYSAVAGDLGVVPSIAELQAARNGEYLPQYVKLWLEDPDSEVRQVDIVLSPHVPELSNSRRTMDVYYKAAGWLTRFINDIFRRHPEVNVGDLVQFEPDERTIGWTQDFRGLEPHHVGTVTKVERNHEGFWIVYVDDLPLGFADFSFRLIRRAGERQRH